MIYMCLPHYTTTSISIPPQLTLPLQLQLTDHSVWYAKMVILYDMPRCFCMLYFLPTFINLSQTLTLLPRLRCYLYWKPSSGKKELLLYSFMCLLYQRNNYCIVIALSYSPTSKIMWKVPKDMDNFCYL